MDDRYLDIFFAAVEATRMPMVVTDPRQPDNPIVFSNPAFSRMTGYTPNEILGRNCRFLQGVETDQGTIQELREAIAKQRDISVEIVNYRKNGLKFWSALFISPIYDNNGNIIYFFGSQLDVSRRRDAEEALVQAQKMEALGQLTGGIAHDFNNLLQVVLGYSDIVQNGLAVLDPPQPRLSHAIEQVHAAAERASVLTQQLLAFARKQRQQGRAVSLNDVVTHTSKLANHTLGNAVVVEHCLAPDLWNARLDAAQAEVALLNILINARDAMPEGGRLVIETQNREIGTGGEAGFSDLTPGRYAVIAVSDTGTGIPREILPRVIDPFFTTKEEGKGTGLGLSMVSGFMRQSGGNVHISSEEGQGTTVRLFFPALSVVEQEQVSSETPDAQGSRPYNQYRGSETVLVVDDRPEVAELAAAILMEFGYQVLRAGDGREALDILDRTATIDLLFSDLIMPGGMNGMMLARESRRRRPQLKVLLATGYAETSLERQDTDIIEFEIVTKPYRRLDLVRRVREVLSEPTSVE